MIFTKEKIHESFCNLPDDRKMELAINCNRYGVEPEDLENTVTGILQAVEKIANKTVQNYMYWKGENKHGNG